MMLKKTTWRLLLLTGLALVGGCLSPIEEPTVTPVSTQPPTAVTDIPTSALPPAPIPGHPAPDFTLPDLESNELRLSDFKGQVVLINFWATW